VGVGPSPERRSALGETAQGQLGVRDGALGQHGVVEQREGRVVGGGGLRVATLRPQLTPAAGLDRHLLSAEPDDGSAMPARPPRCPARRPG
jgi:hypothetical protein